jgi:hypothetical protein
MFGPLGEYVYPTRDILYSNDSPLKSSEFRYLTLPTTRKNVSGGLATGLVCDTAPCIGGNIIFINYPDMIGIAAFSGSLKDILSNFSNELGCSLSLAKCSQI